MWREGSAAGSGNPSQAPIIAMQPYLVASRAAPPASLPLLSLNTRLKIQTICPQTLGWKRLAPHPVSSYRFPYFSAGEIGRKKNYKMSLLQRYHNSFKYDLPVLWASRSRVTRVKDQHKVWSWPAMWITKLYGKTESKVPGGKMQQKKTIKYFFLIWVSKPAWHENLRFNIGEHSWGKDSQLFEISAPT